MTPEQFVYWLQGKLEGRDCDAIPYCEWQCVKDHLATVFKKETPDPLIYRTTSADVYDSGFNTVTKNDNILIC